MTRNAAIYCRISRDRTGGGLGVDRQREDCELLAASLGWRVVAVYTDNDLSAYSGKPRPGYRALLADIEAGRVNAVIAWHTDRLHRSPAELEQYIAVCDTREIPTHCVKAGPLDLTTPSGRLVARQLGAVARYEVEQMSVRQRRQKLQAGRAGQYRGGRRPFGFKADGISPIPEESAAIADGSRRVLCGETLASIARDWAARGLKTSAGLGWNANSVRAVLVRPRNAAIIELDGAEVVAEWPALVPRDIWQAVQVILGDPERRRPRSNELRWLGSGLFLCGVCDDGTTVRNNAVAGSKRAAYRCKKGPHLVRVCEPVDTYVEELVLARVSRPDARTLLSSTEDHESLDELRASETVLVRKLDKFADDYRTELLDSRQYGRLKAHTEADLTAVRERLAVAASRSPLEGLVGAADLRAAWEGEDFPVSRRKAVIGALMTVTLLKAPRGRRPGGGYFDPDCVQVEWRSD